MSTAGQEHLRAILLQRSPAYACKFPNLITVLGSVSLQWAPIL